MITRVTIKKTQKATTDRGVHDLIDSGQAEQMFFACLVEISIINTHPPIFILFRYKYEIGESIWLVHFFDKINI
jgi:hypothetical protein